MLTILSEVELAHIDRMTRPQVIHAIQARAADLPVDLLEGLKEQSIHRLQLTLLAGRLIQVLRHIPDCV
jgi:hypothetical protein